MSQPILYQKIKNVCIAGFFISAIANVHAGEGGCGSFRPTDVNRNCLIHITSGSNINVITARTDSKPYYYNNIGEIRNIKYPDSTGLVTYLGNQVCIASAHVFKQNMDNKRELISNVSSTSEDYLVTFLLPSATKFESKIDDFMFSDNSNLVMFYLKNPIQELIEIKPKAANYTPDEERKWYLVQSNISSSIGRLGSAIFNEDGFLIGMCTSYEKTQYINLTDYADYINIQRHWPLNTVMPYIDYFVPSFLQDFWLNSRTVNETVQMNMLFNEYYKNWIEGTQKDLYEKYLQKTEDIV